MNRTADCERARLQLMAALDGEQSGAAEDLREEAGRHLTACASCGVWLRDLESLNLRFHDLSYPHANLDLWTAVEARVRQSATQSPATNRLWQIGAAVLGWRALELVIDLPFPMLHPIVPLAAAVVLVWHLAADPLAIETFAPELQKRGV